VEELTDLDLTNLGLLSALLATILVVAAKNLATRLSDDLYDGTKGVLANLWRLLFQRRKPTPLASRQGVADAPSPAVSPTPPSPTAAPPTGESPAFATPKGGYFGLQSTGSGDLCRIYQAELRPRGASPQAQAVILKVQNDPGSVPLMHNEASTLRALYPDARQYAKHLPMLIEQFRSGDGRLVTVLEQCEGFSLAGLRERFPDGVEPRHVVWIFRRCLSLLGYVHSRGILHGNLRPEHILVRPQDHNIWILDWSYAIQRPAETGQGFRVTDPLYGPPEAQAHKAPLPASDLFSLGRCMVYLLGGDPATGALPATTPERLARMVNFFLRESPLQRPQDAWEMYNQLEKLRDELFGPHRFVEFRVE
jgi:serine/threonine protein kinase